MTIVKKVVGKIRSLFKKASRAFLRLCPLVIFFLPLLVIRIYLANSKNNYRLLNINIKRIGHLCFDTDAFIKEKILAGESPKSGILIVNRKLVSNAYVIKYLSQYVTVVENPILCFLLTLLKEQKFRLHDCSKYAEVHTAGHLYYVQQKWEPRGPLFKLSKEDADRGRAALKLLGLPEDAWWVCVHSRESGYSLLSGPHDFGQGFRNSGIDSYDLAVEHITKLGGWCIRMGDSTMQPIKPQSHYIDYAHSEFKEDWLDLYLGASAKMFLGNTSGAYALGRLFGVPVAAANMIPLSTVFVYGAGDIAIPKLLRNKKTQKLASYREIFSANLADSRADEAFLSSEYEIVDNSAEEIKDLLVEQLARLDSSFLKTNTDIENSRIFRKLFPESAHTFHSTSEMSLLFLRRHQDLLN